MIDAPAGRRAHTAGLGMALDAVPAEAERRTWTLLVSAGAGPVAGAALIRER